MDQELIAYLDRMSQQIEGLRGEMSQRMDGLQEENRHTRVGMEGLRSDVQLLAETVMDTRELFARHESKVEQRLGEIQTMITLPFKDLYTRVTLLEERAERQERDAMAVIREKFGKRQA